jgi:hypothetical protein
LNRPPALASCFEHDLFRKPLHTFRDHALAIEQRPGPRFRTFQDRPKDWLTLLPASWRGGKPTETEQPWAAMMAVAISVPIPKLASLCARSFATFGIEGQ